VKTNNALLAYIWADDPAQAAAAGEAVAAEAEVRRAEGRTSTSIFESRMSYAEQRRAGLPKPSERVAESGTEKDDEIAELRARVQELEAENEFPTWEDDEPDEVTEPEPVAELPPFDASNDRSGAAQAAAEIVANAARLQ
jgi:hypothetical protein